MNIKVSLVNYSRCYEKHSYPFTQIKLQAKINPCGIHCFLWYQY